MVVRDVHLHDGLENILHLEPFLRTAAVRLSHLTSAL
jgi:hypothetical protein